MEQFFTRRHKRDQKLREKESSRNCESRLAHEQAQVSRPWPGNKGSLVFSWDDVDGFQIRTPVPRSQVRNLWNSRWKTSEKIYNGFDNCWDCCSLFGDNTLPGEPEPSDSESDDFSMFNDKSPGVNPQFPPAPENHAAVDGVNHQHPSSANDYILSMASTASNNQNSEPPPTSRNVDPESEQQPGLLLTDTIDQLTADHHTIPLEDENEEDMGGDDLYQASSNDVLAANSFYSVSFTSSCAQTVEELIYYRFGFLLNEHPYSGVPPSICLDRFHNWHEVICAVGGDQTMSTSGTNWDAITDFLGCLLSSRNSLQDVPGKFWDLSLEGADPLKYSTTKFICIEKCQFNDGTQYLLRPSNLHPSRDTSWVIAVDALITLECIRHGLG